MLTLLQTRGAYTKMIQTVELSNSNIIIGSVLQQPRYTVRMDFFLIYF
jgi:hypothetical protein